jgi:MFS family permease
VVHPDKPIISVSGDSAIGFSGMEMETVCRYQLPVKIVVFNNGGIGPGHAKHPENPLKNMRPNALIYGARYDKMMEAFGGKGFFVEDPKHIRGASFGLRQSLDTIGAFVGPLLAIGLMWLTADHFVFVFWIAVIPAFLAFALILVAVREPKRPEGLRQVRMPLSRVELGRLDAAYWWVVAIATIFTLARFSEAFLVLRAQAVGLPLMFVPVVLVVMNVVYALSAYPVGAVSDRMSRTSLLIVGLLALLAADLVLAFAHGMVAVAVGAALWGLHMGFTQGLFAALIADTAPPELRGTAYGVFNLTTGLALLLASVIAGALWDLAGPQGTFLAGAAFTILTLIGLVPIRRRLS